MGWCLLLQESLATAESVLTALSSHLVPSAAPLLCQEAEPGTPVKPGVLLGTTPYVHLRNWQLHESLFPQCL